MISVEIEVASGGFQTISGFAKVLWQHQLNGNSFFEVVVAGSEEDYFVDYVTGLKVKFLKNGVLDMIGVVEKINYTSEGLMVLEGAELGASVYSSVSCGVNTFDSSSVGSIVGVFQSLTGNKVVLGTINSSSVDKFRTHSSQTCLQALYKLAELEGKDWFFDYSGDSARINVVDKKGSSKVALLNGGVDVGVVTKEVDDSEKVKKVTVVGASYGNNQIIKSAVDGYVLGDAEVTIVDKSIITDANALKRANLELSIRKNSKFNYKFDVVDFNREFVTGDTVELLDKRTNTDAELRIVSVKRLAGGDEEFLELEVRSVDDRERLEDRLRQEIALRSFSENAVSMNQKVDDTVLSGNVDISASGTADVNVNVTGSGSGSANKDYADMKKSGEVGFGFTGSGFEVTERGYSSFGHYSAVGVGSGESGWKTLSTSINTYDTDDYLFHACYATLSFNYNFDYDATTTVYTDVPKFRIKYYKNTNPADIKYWPNIFGINAVSFTSVKFDKHTHLYDFGLGETHPTTNNTISFVNNVSCYIFIPYSLRNCSYVLECWVENKGYWTVDYFTVGYGYHGAFAHKHSDNIVFSDDGHTHGVSVSGSGSGSGSGSVSVSGGGTASIPAHTHGVL